MCGVAHNSKSMKRVHCSQDGKRNAERCVFQGKHSMLPNIEGSPLHNVTKTVYKEMLRMKVLVIAQEKCMPLRAFKASNEWIRCLME